MEKPKQAALYIRFANEEQPFIDLQKEKLICNAKNQGYTNLKVYQDNGFSGLNMERPAFKQMLINIENGKIGTVMSASMSRFGRDYFHLQGFINTLKRNNVQIDTMDKSHEGFNFYETVKKNMDIKLLAKSRHNRHDR